MVVAREVSLDVNHKHIQCNQVHAVCKEDGCSVGFCAAHNEGLPIYMFGMRMRFRTRNQLGYCEMCTDIEGHRVEAGMYRR